MRTEIEQGLTRGSSPLLVKELLNSYEEAKKNFLHGGTRLAAVEVGGRFCEAALPNA
jgi:hypothetical protein